MGKWNGGMGPQEIITKQEVEQRIRDERKSLYDEFRGGIICGCLKCSEPFKLGADASIEDAKMLEKWLGQGHCPYCKDGKMQHSYELIKQKKLWSNISHTFKIRTETEEIEIYCLRLGKI